MPKYYLTAIRTTTYEVSLEADSLEEALKAVDDWIADDFEPYQTDNRWSINADEGDEY